MVVLLRDHRPQSVADFVELLLRGTTIGRPFIHPRFYLLLQPCNPHHEELVQVVAENSHELQSFEQRRARVEGFVQHPIVKFQPTEFAVEIVLGITEIGFGDCFFGSRHIQGVP